MHELDLDLPEDLLADVPHETSCRVALPALEVLGKQLKPGASAALTSEQEATDRLKMHSLIDFASEQNAKATATH